MRVLLVCEPGKDGVFRHVESLTRFLLGKGVEVAFAYSDCRADSQLPRLLEELRGVGSALLNLRVGNGPQIGDFQATVRLARFVERIRPDVIHAHSSKAGALVRLLALAGLRIPIVYTPNAYYGMSLNGGNVAVLFDVVEAFLGRIGTTINVSGDEARFGRCRLRLRPDRQVICPNPSDTMLYRPPEDAARRLARERLNLPLDARVLGVIARDCPQKDLPTLYRAFALVAAEDPSLYLVHLGRGDTTSLIRSLGCDGRIVRLEYLEQPLSFYHAIDAYAMSSIYEGFSLAAVEALACDLPLILTLAPGNREFFRIGLSHLWGAEPGDVAAFVEAIRAWRADCDQPRSSNHRSIACARFSIDRCFSRILALYEEKVARRGSARLFAPENIDPAGLRRAIHIPL